MYVWIRQAAGTIAERELIGYTVSVSESKGMQPKSPSVSPILERTGVF
jgi:hypothetical protein